MYYCWQINTPCINDFVVIALSLSLAIPVSVVDLPPVEGSLVVCVTVTNVTLLVINLVCIVAFVVIALSLYVDNTDLTGNDISSLDVGIAETEGQKDIKSHAQYCHNILIFSKITYLGEKVLYF